MPTAPESDELPSPSTRRRVTDALQNDASSPAGCDDDLSVRVYDDLRRMAGNLLRRERANHTLQPTALVHEAWLRLVNQSELTAQGHETARRRFLGYAVQAMRRILIEHARARMRDKRGGGLKRVPISESILPGVEDAPQLLDLDAALDELAERKPRAARIAALRVYGGLSTSDAADVVGVSPATAKLDWTLAKGFLTRRVRGCDGDDA